MATEFYSRGGVTKGAEQPYDMTKYLGARVGLGEGRVGFSWDLHPEEGVRRVFAARGATDAYGIDFSPAEFVAMLRNCARQDWNHCIVHRATKLDGARS